MNKKCWSKDRRAKYAETIAARRKAGGKTKAGGNHCEPKKIKPRCATCDAFREDRKSELTGLVSGKCCAHPPTAHINHCAWPTVDGLDWCREHHAKE
ncbi:MAG TPA: hypothetical protein DDY86_04025 [Syntrophaceae bacterium]|nr:hypothetical protein [Syntrophaceae bacterium]